MNPPETQSDSSSEETYFDPEAMDPSEQQFSASLDASATAPSFVVDSQDSVSTNSNSNSNQAMGRRASRPSTTNQDEQAEQDDTMGRRTSRPSTPDPTQDTTMTDPQPTETDWRDQVSAKVKHYKTIKPQKDRYPSLQLQFDAVVPWKTENSPLHAERAEFLASAQTEYPTPAFEAEPTFSYPVSSEATARVLEFPRPGMLPFNPDELAEPVHERPRIVEAPELLPPPPALGGMLIESVREPEPERQPGVDMPLQTARLSRRIFAGIVDGIFVAVATAIFGYMFLRFNPALPQARTTAEVAAALAVVLWFAYQAAFLICCGTTPGLRATRLNLSCFDGRPVSRNLRRWRVVASALSFVSLGLGYAWSFLDEDQLSWHDRITKTHLATKT